MYPQDVSWFDTAGRLLLVAFFLAVGIWNLQKHHIEDHISRLTKFKAPFPTITFWTGQAMEFVGCALVSASCIPQLVSCCSSCSRSWRRLCCSNSREVEGPMRTGMQNGMLAKIGIVGGLLLLLQNVL